MKEKKYLISKETNTKEIVYLDYDKLEGFEFNPKNRVKYEGIAVNKMVVIKPSFVEKVLKRKVKNRLDLYLQFIIGILDDDDTDPTSLRMVLNDLDRYRRTIINKYQKYLDEKYISLLLKKITLLENEIKSKIIQAKVKEEIEIQPTERKRGR